MFKSRVFTFWFVCALGVWSALFYRFNSPEFLAANWYYPAIMVVGAFVAGLTPEGGGAVAFPVLSIFLSIDRVLARDFSLMIQSIGMTSASIYLLWRPGAVREAYRPLRWFVPVCFAGFVAGMLTLQTIPVYLIQALFLSLITTFAIAYVFGEHRGTEGRLQVHGSGDKAMLALILFVGGMCTSLFGTGADIIIYCLLVTRFRMQEKTATQISIILMASMSVLGFGYRHFVDQGLTHDQVKTWLCAYPVVLFMAPFGAYILQKVHVDWMLKGVVALNVGQLLYFNFNKPAAAKWISSGIFCAVLMIIFRAAVGRLSKRPQGPAGRQPLPEPEPAGP